MTAQETLGRILAEEMGRDAVHIALAPTIARVRLKPGQRVGVDGDAHDSVGIVDPFLGEPVEPGQRFWLFLDPNTITSLRHVWEHPAYPEASEEVIPKTSEETQASEDWLRELADAVGISYQQLLDGADDYVRRGSRYIVGGTEMEGKRVPDEFWDHYEIVTGEKVPEADRGSFFSCSC